MSPLKGLEVEGLYWVTRLLALSPNLRWLPLHHLNFEQRCYLLVYHMYSICHVFVIFRIISLIETKIKDPLIVFYFSPIKDLPRSTLCLYGHSCIANCTENVVYIGCINSVPLSPFNNLEFDINEFLNILGVEKEREVTNI